jgi:hypothetical protein
VHVRQIAGPRTQLDALCRVDQRREEHKAVANVLGLVCQVFTDEYIVKAELVGQDDGLSVFLQSLGGVAMQRVHRHHEHAQFHRRGPLGLVLCVRGSGRKWTQAMKAPRFHAV